MDTFEEDKQLLEQIRIREELENRGYTRKHCQKCDGKGIIAKSWMDNGFYELFIGCFHCKGRGYTWEAPLIN